MSVYWASSAKLYEASRTRYYDGTSHNIDIAHPSPCTSGQHDSITLMIE
ncbi:hypothetical protein PspLS_08303 [Pyricularia sp. CBS 133598]|nr:hypothetical protein PspLS_08303 [Pyricularia sp. CBS 133598]